MCKGTRFVLFPFNTSYRCNTSHNKLCNWHADSSRRSIVHLSRERTPPRDLELNLSQMSHSFQSLQFSFTNCLNSPMSHSRRLMRNNLPSIAMLRCHCQCTSAMLMALLPLGLTQVITSSDQRLCQQRA